MGESKFDMLQLQTFETLGMSEINVEHCCIRKNITQMWGTQVAHSVKQLTWFPPFMISGS